MYAIVTQDREMQRDMEEYAFLADQVQKPEAESMQTPVEIEATVLPLIREISTETPAPLLKTEKIATDIPLFSSNSQTTSESQHEAEQGAIIVVIPSENAENHLFPIEEHNNQQSLKHAGEDTAYEQTEKGQSEIGKSTPHQTPKPTESGRQGQQQNTPFPATIAPIVVTNTPQPTSSPTPVPRIGKTGVDLDSCKAQNSDFVAWLKIPGTKINYPVVWTDQVNYYLTHTFSGKESKIGTLFSLGKTDYQSPGKNIAIYGHHITTSGGNMFQPLMSYKQHSFWENHKTVYLDTLYHLGEYTIFAVINMQNGEWDPAAASFGSDQAFLNFVQMAKSHALYDTGIEVTANDHIITLITCDRSYHDKSGRLLVLAVEQ